MIDLVLQFCRHLPRVAVKASSEHHATLSDFAHPLFTFGEDVGFSPRIALAFFELEVDPIRVAEMRRWFSVIVDHA